MPSIHMIKLIVYLNICCAFLLITTDAQIAPQQRSVPKDFKKKAMLLTPFKPRPKATQAPTPQPQQIQPALQPQQIQPAQQPQQIQPAPKPQQPIQTRPQRPKPESPSNSQQSVSRQSTQLNKPNMRTLRTTVSPKKVKNPEENLYMLGPSIKDSDPVEKNMYLGCRSGKTCVEDIPGCHATSACNFFLTYTDKHDMGIGYYRFEGLAKLPKGYGYVALGLSTDKLMGSDSVVECVAEKNGNLAIYMSWNEAHDNKRLAGQPCRKHSKGPLTGCNITLVDGKIMCNFYRRTITKVHSQVFDLDKVSYFVIGASSHIIQPPDPLGVWKNKDVIHLDSDDNITFSILGNIGMHNFKHSSGKARSIIRQGDEDELDLGEIMYLKLHGILMIIGWIFIVPNAIYLVRYFKETWNTITYFDQPYWIFIHTASMCLAGIFFTLGVLSGLWYTFNYDESAFLDNEEIYHVVLGTAALFLFVVQMLLGYCRPSSTKGRKRKIANVIHFFLGTISYLTAVVVILRAHKMTTSFFPCSSFVVVVVWIIWSFVLHLFVIIEIFVKERKFGLRSARVFLPWPMKVLLEDDMTGQRYRLDVFAFHAAGAGLTCTLLILPYLVSKAGCLCREEILCFEEFTLW